MRQACVFDTAPLLRIKENTDALRLLCSATKTISAWRPEPE